MLKKKVLLTASILIIVSTLAIMISAAPIVKSYTSAKLSAADAENIALEAAGLTRESVRFERTELDRERGKLIWEVEFDKGNIEYSFDINAETGEIVYFDQEPERRKPSPPETQPPAPITEPPTPMTEPPTPMTEPPTPTTEPPTPTTEPPTPTTEPPAPATDGITRERAIEIALSDAGLTRDQVRDLDAEKDYERGTLVYEIDFKHGRNEYEYEIRISDGKVLTNSVEIDD